MSDPSRLSTIHANWPWLVGYAVLVLAVLACLVAVRGRVLTVDLRGTERAAWDQWRADAATQSGIAGPVQRTVPKSVEPPIRVLMRDYFAATAVGLLSPITALYVFAAWVIRGVARQSRRD